MVGVRRIRRAQVLRMISWRQGEEQLEKVAQGDACVRRRMPAPGHMVVETNGKQCEVRQEEEHDDEDIQVRLVLH